MPYYHHQGVSLYYESENFNSKNDTFVFLHGLGGSTEQCKSTFTCVPDGLNMIYVDLRGNGRSDIGDPKELSFSSLAKDINILCQHLGLQQIIIGGISMGAAVATKFSLYYPDKVKRLILIRVAWLNRPMERESIENFSRIADLIEQYELEEAKEIYTSEKYYLNQLKYYPYNAYSNAACFDYPLAKQAVEKYRIMPLEHPIDSIEELRNIQVPTLLLGNKNDPLHPFSYAEIYHKHIPHSLLYEIPSKNLDSEQHFIKINKYVKQFLAGDLVV